MEPMHGFELLIAMLVAVIALHYVARKSGLSPAVALLAGGALLTLPPSLPVIALDPGLVLAIFLPPLLMDGAWFIPLAPLKRHLIGIASLATGAVIFTTAVVAAVTHWMLPSLPWAVCAALGATVSPPDAVSARAVLQRVRLPHRLSILLEGESLLNDATGLVLFRFAIAAAATGAFSAIHAFGSFLFLALGGAIVGAVIGGAWALLVRRLEDEYLIIATTVLVAWAAYISGESLHVSGVIATVTAGIICGWYQHVIFSASIRMRGTSFWTVLIFLMEASVFLLIGCSLRGVVDRVGGFGVVLQEMAVPILVILLALTAARFVWIYGSDLVIRIAQMLGGRWRPVGARGAAILSWTGMRGVVTLAVALSVPEDIPGRDFILVTAFAVILGTVLIQGTTLGLIIGWADLEAHDSRYGPRLTMSQAEAVVAAVQAKVVEEHAYAPDGTLIHPRLLERYRRIADLSAEYAADQAAHSANLHAHFDVVLTAVAAGRAELLRLHRTGDIDEETLRELERDLDLQELGALAAKA